MQLRLCGPRKECVTQRCVRFRNATKLNSALFNELILGKRDVPGFLIKEYAKSARCGSKTRQWLMSNHNINRA